MNRSLALALLAATVALSGLTGLSGLSAPSASGTSAALPLTATYASTYVSTYAASAVEASPVQAVVNSAIQPAPAPNRAPEHAAPTVATTTAVAVRKTAQTAVAVVARPTATSNAARTAYINSLYRSVVPAGERVALAGRYVLGYNLPGLSCGTGCTGLFNGQARSSFNSTFFTESLAYQRNRIAHEAAHAYGFLFISNYATPSWAGVGGWQTQFHNLDRSFVRTYDAEAWAACVAWKETGFNNRIDQISRVCTPAAAIAAMAQIP